MSKHWEQNKEATVYVGNIDERVTQELLAELMAQTGTVIGVHMPNDRVSQTHQGYGFVEFETPEAADYAAKVLNGVRLWGKPIRVNKASADKQKSVDIGAELFINNLDPQVDEKILFDTFGQFGNIIKHPNIVRDDNNISKGYGFVSFGSFEASDAARDTMNGETLFSKQISVEYAYKKDGKGERHGDEAERKLAAEGKKHNIVPEQQPLPAGYHMTSGQAPAATPVAPAFPEPNLTSPVGRPMAGQYSKSMGNSFGAPPAFGIAPPMAPARSGLVLPRAPSGLPARPPPSQAGYAGPVGDFHPGASNFRGGPSVHGQPPGYPVMHPPPGFPAPPLGFPAPGLPALPGPPGFPVNSVQGYTPPPGTVPPNFVPNARR